ncbi:MULTISPECIES: EscF/YscF/HrpA family type III secretion system needle major subunit [unclassified Bordetella]|uniref:EscF/YscF/HrpA family type III secretion system needle major subunit n=1 Tax=unclassified Bordetella TaxID=2630031 RepID=UPI0013282F58|nr:MULTISPECIES: EscF/YscF/HrpA family type III secretion system needle major subunit [unclassified Bordetella]MVW70496.1 type III secretion protein [Bordetella sp. 15P40C-2]MVW78565.1 type III secretion protein [Bordetella sp. 02P26C-1]
MALPITGGLNVNSVNNTLGSALQTKEAQFASTMSSIEARGSDSMTAVDLLQVQQQLQQINMFVDLMSTIIKSFSDSVKGVIQKSG